MTTNIRKEKIKILAVGAHPDDIELGAAMTLRRHILNGDSIYYIVCSDGEKGGDIKKRTKEMEESASLMGVKRVYRLNYPDSALDARGIINPLEKIFYEVNPTKVFFHNPFDKHQDHNAVSQACNIAFRKAPNLFMYRSPRTSVSFEPHLFFSGNEQDFSFKEKVLRKYLSQIRKGAIDIREIKAEAIFWASVGFPYQRGVYCEPFLVNHMNYQF